MSIKMKAVILAIGFAFLLGLTLSSAANAKSDPFIDDIIATMNTSVNPCEDFYEYACGGWLSSTELPDDRARLEKSFTLMQIEIEKALEEIVTDPKNTKLNAFYNACMDVESMNKRGLSNIIPLAQNILDYVDGLPTFFTASAQLSNVGVSTVAYLVSTVDAYNPSKVIMALYQSGLGLPSEAMYFGEQGEKFLGPYKEYITKVMRVIAPSLNMSISTEEFAEKVLALEIAMAHITIPPDQLIDPFATYNRFVIKDFQSQVSRLPWNAYFDMLQVDENEFLAIEAPSYYHNLTQVLKQHEGSLKYFATWKLISSTVELLTDELRTYSYEFNGAFLNGLKSPPPRNRTCFEAVDEGLGQLLGHAYAKAAFGEDGKEAVENIIGTIIDTMRENVKTLDWMDEETRVRALEKLDKVQSMVGFPEIPYDYRDVKVGPDHFLNVLTARTDNTRRELRARKLPADRAKWEMTPNTVNAYYEPTKNIMVYPAGILQSPFFGLSQPTAANYGGFGMVAGHELTHGFDSMGRNYDGDGKLVDWWEPETSRKFQKKVQCVIDQWAKFEILPGVFVNGELTQGENVADMGGLKNSFRSLLRIMGSEIHKPSPVPGLTNAQLFFVGHAQGWCSKRSPEFARVAAQTDPHSPPRFRVIGSCMNLPEFAEAFQCAPNTPMNPTEKCEVW